MTVYRQSYITTMTSRNKYTPGSYSNEAPLPSPIQAFSYSEHVSTKTAADLHSEIFGLYCACDMNFRTDFSNTGCQDVAIPRKTHHEHVQETFANHETLRDDAYWKHQTDLNAVMGLNIVFEETRKQLTNAKRVRNTERNHLKRQISSLLKIATNLNDMMQCPQSVCDSIRVQIESLRSRFQHIKENYNSSAKAMSKQIRRVYGEILEKILTLQQNDHTRIGQLIESAKSYTADALLSTMMALQEFAAEKEWQRKEHYEGPIDARVEKDRDGQVVLTVQLRESELVIARTVIQDISSSKVPIETCLEFFEKRDAEEMADSLMQQQQPLDDATKSWWQITPTHTPRCIQYDEEQPTCAAIATEPETQQ